MSFNGKVLSVVCARAGSKGLKNKCIARIGGKMVVEYSIEYSISLGDKVKTVVSTDIKELIDFCEKNNIIYVRRNPRFGSDDSRIDDAIAEAIEKEGEDCEYCSLVYGNIPTRYPDLFRDALEFLVMNEDYDAVLSFQNVEKFHPEWMFDFNPDLLPHKKETHYRRQALPQKMIHDGHTFVFRKEKFYGKYKGLIQNKKGYMYFFYGDRIKPQIHNDAVIDIDTAKDLRLAETLLRVG